MTKSVFYNRDYEKTEIVDFSELEGKTLKSIENKGDELLFTTDDGVVYRQIYYSDCCASCDVEEIHGDLEDLVGTPILKAEEVSSNDPGEDVIAARKAKYDQAKAEYRGDPSEFYRYYGATPDNNWREESETWTFYKASTIKGSVTIRWYGSSNGYYSESPTFERIKND